MIGQFIPGLGFIDYAKTDFTCPHCQAPHADEYDKYLDRCNKNKSGYTKIRCYVCEKKFGFTYDYTGDAVGFKLYTKKEWEAEQKEKSAGEIFYEQADSILEIKREKK